MRSAVFSFLIVIALVLVAFFSYRAGTLKYRSQLVVLQGKVDIYKNEAEQYAKVLRSIRETAATATVTEKAQ